MGAGAAYRDYLATETLAVELHLDGLDVDAAAMDHSEQAVIDGLSLSIALRRVQPQPGSS
jgi:hypothetical protein